MKKFFTLFAMVAMALTMQADMYIVGSDPFGNWHTYAGQKMEDNGDGTYSLTVELSGTIWFVFADNLTPTDGVDEWDLFNGEYRFGPSTGADQKVVLGEYIATQKQGNGNGAYQLACGTEPSEFTFMFDSENMEFIVEGAAEVDPDWTYATVAGNSAAVFGTTWDPTNTDNDMTMNEEGIFVLDKYNCLLEEGNLEFKVVSNHDWGLSCPASNYQYYIEQAGYYDVHFTFDTLTQEIGCMAELVGEPIPPEPIEAMYILGEVNGNGWAPNVGVPMDTEDKITYTAKVEATGTNTEEGDETQYSYFSFTSKLAEGDDWGAITGSRLGAVEGGYLVSEDMLNVPMELVKGDNSFKIPSGKYIVTVDVEDMTVIIAKDSGVDELVAGKIVAGERYYNVMGQEVTEANGVTIVVTRYTDGTVKTTKVMK